MSTNEIDPKQFSAMFLMGAKNLEANKEWINELNVFPVPDGDTGTNMTMTIMSAVRELIALGDTDNMKDICKAISSGSLRGARGNSGVILSQLIRGFGKITKTQTVLTVPIVADAFDRAVETAYKAVMKPKEGTILTVAKAAAEKARELCDKGVLDFDNFCPAVVEHADYILSQTPEMLPVLKQAGVVDSGGQGLVCVLKGAFEAFQGKDVDYTRLAEAFDQDEKKAAEEKAEPEETTEEADEGPVFLYRCRYNIYLERKFSNKIERDLRNFLNSIGGSVICDNEGDMVRVHLHTNDPGLALQKGLLYGQLSDIRIENIVIAKQKKAQKAAEETLKIEKEMETRKASGFITVSVGEGISSIFKELGVDYVISGGQTMNPSTDDFLSAIAKVNADTIYVLPNNKNIILAANQAASLTKDKKVIVIPTTSIPEGITAVINFMPDLDADTNKENMTEAIRDVVSAEVTYAVRDTTIDGVSIAQGDIMGISDGKIISAGKDRDDTTFETIKGIVKDDTEVISIYYGADVNEEDAEKLKERVSSAFSSCDVELQDGGQPIYYYMISAE